MKLKAAGCIVVILLIASSAAFIIRSLKRLNKMFESMTYDQDDIEGIL